MQYIIHNNPSVSLSMFFTRLLGFHSSTSQTQDFLCGLQKGVSQTDLAAYGLVII